MPEVDLEAEQVVGEEADESSKKGGGKTRKGIIIFASVLLVQAVVLFFVFSMISGGPADATSTKEEESRVNTTNLGTFVEKPRLLDLGMVAIYDESDTQRGAPRRYTAKVKVYILNKYYAQLEEVNEGANPDALEFVKDYMRLKVKEWMLESGGESLRTRLMQNKAREKLKTYLKEEIPSLRDAIDQVMIDDFRPQKW